MSDDEIRIIKKYPNRRVYDTQKSKYIKIEDIRSMVIEGINFKVLDNKTKEDVTRSVLLQIIIEQESETNPLFTSDNLKHFIKYYGQNQNDQFSEYMNQSLAFFHQQQEQFNLSMQELINNNPVNVFSDISKKNAEIWREIQSSFFSQMSKDSKNKS